MKTLIEIENQRRLSHALELESKMIPRKNWHTAHPEAYAMAEEATAEGIPAGIAHDAELGWCVLMSGQGPYIAWCEQDYNIDLDRLLTSREIDPDEDVSDIDTELGFG